MLELIFVRGIVPYQGINMQRISGNVFILFNKRQGNQSGGKENKTKGLKCKKQEIRTQVQKEEGLGCKQLWIRAIQKDQWELATSPGLDEDKN